VLVDVAVDGLAISSSCVPRRDLAAVEHDDVVRSEIVERRVIVVRPRITSRSRA
jgi:hypothetical protein